MKNLEPTKEKLNKKGTKIIIYETKNESRSNIIRERADIAMENKVAN